jgi:hypothetical protein
VGSVRLVDGTEVDSASEAWRAECEARTVLRMEQHKQREFLAGCVTKRGIGADAKVRAAMYRVWPAFVLDMPSVADRRAYLAQVGHEIGPKTKAELEERILSLHKFRKENTCAVAAE